MTKLYAIGLTILCLTLCVACSSKQPKIVTDTKVVRVCPPVHLMEPIPAPDCVIEANGDLVDCLKAYQGALDKSNADKIAIRKSVEVTE